MKTFKRLLFISAILLVALSVFYVFWLSPRYTVPLLMYHRFGYETSTLFVNPENFERQMAYIKKKGYNVISLDEFVQGINGNRRFRHNTVVITVDDGYQDNYKYAYPILKRYNFPATIFVIANFIGNNKEFLTWDEARAMLKNNITIGAHTKNHVYLPSVTSEDILWDEIAGAKGIIEKNIGVPIDYFCYPTGGFNGKIKEMVKKAGYKAACTTNRGLDPSLKDGKVYPLGLTNLNKDLYELKRIKITNSDTNKPFSFWAKLSGYYNLFRSKKRGD